MIKILNTDILVLMIKNPVTGKMIKVSGTTAQNLLEMNVALPKAAVRAIKNAKKEKKQVGGTPGTPGTSGSKPSLADINKKLNGDKKDNDILPFSMLFSDQ